MFGGELLASTLKNKTPKHFRFLNQRACTHGDAAAVVVVVVVDDDAAMHNNDGNGGANSSSSLSGDDEDEDEDFVVADMDDGQEFSAVMER